MWGLEFGSSESIYGRSQWWYLSSQSSYEKMGPQGKRNPGNYRWIDLAYTSAKKRSWVEQVGKREMCYQTHTLNHTWLYSQN